MFTQQGRCKMADDLVTLQTYEFVQQAEMAKWVLEQEGILAFVANANMVMNNLPFNASLLGYARLEVPSSQVDAAMEVLQRNPGLLKARYFGASTETAEEESPDVCLNCREPMPENAASCSACGWSYESGEKPEV
jgi:hypothetical protein